MKTNKNYWILAATVLTTSLFTACNEKKQAETAEVNVPAEELTASTADEIFTTEPLTINKKGPKGTNISYQLRIDFPSQGPEQLLSSARKAIKRVMLGAEADDRTTKEGLDAIAQRFIETSSREIQELQSAATEESSLAYTYEGTILMTENTATYITYHLNDYLYSGGAHGASRDFSFTISKTGAQQMDWNDIIRSECRKDLEAKVKKAIIEEYYRGEEPEWGEVFKFALPEQAPALTDSGLIFNYASYEIDCYAAGKPHCTLPYDEVREMMTPEAQALIRPLTQDKNTPTNKRQQ